MTMMPNTTSTMCCCCCCGPVWVCGWANRS